MQAWLSTYNRDLPLLDVVNDPDASEVDTRLAALSLGQGLDSGYYDAEALADALAELHAELANGIAEPDSEARRGLSDLLLRGGAYTRSLYDEVKSLPSIQAVWHLDDHAQRMLDRADMGRLVCNQAGAVTVA